MFCHVNAAVICIRTFRPCVWTWRWSARRQAAIQEGLQQAVGVPLALAERTNLLWPYLKDMVVYGNISCKSDAQVHPQLLIVNTQTCRVFLFISVMFSASPRFLLQVAAKALETAVFGAYYNVTINLKDITDEDFKTSVRHPSTLYANGSLFGRIEEFFEFQPGSKSQIWLGLFVVVDAEKSVGVTAGSKGERCCHPPDCRGERVINSTWCEAPNTH